MLHVSLVSYTACVYMYMYVQLYTLYVYIIMYV